MRDSRDKSSSSADLLDKSEPSTAQVSPEMTELGLPVTVDEKSKSNPAVPGFEETVPEAAALAECMNGTRSVDDCPKQISQVQQSATDRSKSGLIQSQLQGSTMIIRDDETCGDPVQPGTLYSMNASGSIDVDDDLREQQFQALLERPRSPSVLGDLERLDYCEPRGSCQYELRADANKWQINFCGADRDFDETGDYEPSDKMLDAKPLKRKVSSSNPVSVDEDNKTPATKRPRSRLLARQDGEALLLTFRFTTSKPREYQRNIGTSSDNWPYQETWNRFCDLPPDTITRLLQENRRVSRSQTAAESYASTSQPVEPLHLGHPIARSCKKCIDGEQVCSLLACEAVYPCANCRVDQCDCEIAGIGFRKRACQTCLILGLKCSNDMDGHDHDQPCNRCASRNLKCVAGPYVDPSRTRIQANGKPAPRQVVKGAYTACTSCRQNRKTCSFLKEPSNGQSCELCSRYELPCVLIPLAEKEAAKKELKRKQAQANQIVVNTALSHPITFYTTQSECKWCTKAAFGLIGWGKARDVKVEPSKDGTHYTEISGGFCEQDKPPASMCYACTQDRVKIIGCVSHMIRTIPGASPVQATVATVEEAVSKLRSCKSPKDIRHEMLKWCTVCRRPAFSACHRCPLRLCLTCSEAFLGLNEIKARRTQECFTTMIKRYTDGQFPRKLYPFGLRADVSLLRLNGLLFCSVSKRQRSRVTRPIVG